MNLFAYIVKKFLKILKILILISSLFFTFSCSKKYNPNLAFNERYGSEVEKINQQRKWVKQNTIVKKKTRFAPPTQEYVTDTNVYKTEDEQRYYPYYDISKFGIGNVPRQYTPYGQAQINPTPNSLPPDVFDVVYNDKTYGPYRYFGAKFDQISIPVQDAYGVKSAMDKKLYLMAGNNIVQNTVDDVSSGRSQEDINISKTLIEEQKQLRYKRKMVKIFGEESLEKINENKPSAEEFSNNSQDFYLDDKNNS